MLQLVIADDERTIREGMARLIEDYGLPLNIAGLAQDGRQALTLIDQTHPELLIIDINMPYLNGLETIEQVRRDYPEMKIIIVSGYDQFSYAQKALELGVFSYQLKPLDIACFKSVLIAAIDSYEKRMVEIGLLTKTGYEEALIAPKKDEVKDYLKNHYAQSDFSLSGMAEDFHVSASTMAKLIKQRTGMNFSDYLNQLRIDAAMNLLTETELSINEISVMVGYSSQHYFSRIFKKYKGGAPSAFRKKSGEGNEPAAKE